MINRENFFNHLAKVDYNKMPLALKQACDSISLKTSKGKNWKAIDNNGELKELSELTFQKLEEFLNSASGLSGANKTSDKNTTGEKQPEIKTTFVERLPEELRFIKRYLLLHGKKKYKEEILRFISSLQKAIVEKRIRKTSPYANQILEIQKKLISLHNSMTAKVPVLVKINSATISQFNKLLVSEKPLPSVQIIKRYISLNGKYGIETRKKALILLKLIERAFAKKRIAKSDKYYSTLEKIRKNLSVFVKDRSSALFIEPGELRGLQSEFGGTEQPPVFDNLKSYNYSPKENIVAIQSLDGTEEKEENPQIINSMEFAKMEFPSIGFTGKYLKLIGDPSPGFTVMVYGLPKMGKSMLCMDFAGYLAKNHGRVLYIAKEEGTHRTLQNKMNTMAAQNPNLDLASGIPSEPLDKFDFVFFDSVNTLGLSADDLRRLKKQYPKVSFIYIFQSTKAGNFRGANTFQHDVDSIIEVPQIGKAIQYGRFNQGGEMDFFNENAPKAV